MKYFWGWVPMIFIAIANGIARQELYLNKLGNLHAHQFSTLTAIVLFGLYIYWFINKWKPESEKQAKQIGLFWVILTIAFEFFLGGVIFQRPLSVLLHDYNLLEGRVWILLLVWIGISPILFFKKLKSDL